MLRANSETQAKPYCAVVGNKSDLKHISLVNIDTQARFASENEMNSFLMSAKSGDQVKQAFMRVAASLTGYSSINISWLLINHQRPPFCSFINLINNTLILEYFSVLLIFFLFHCSYYFNFYLNISH